MLVLFIPFGVNASLIKDLDVLNGVLSREFQSTNNYYSVDLDKGNNELLVSYTLEDDASVDIIYEDDLAILRATRGLEVEDYYFYLNIKEDIPVFYEKEDEEKIIPHLKLYVISGCVIIIIILFKVLVIGFKRH